VSADPISIVEADLGRPEHQDAVRAMTDAYSRDPYGDGKPLDPEAMVRLIPGLRRHPTTLIMLAFEGSRPIGAATCFVGFSTFAAKPLVNIHDLVVVPDSRGRGVGRRLLEAVERKARELGCCKLTLEVLDRNQRALGAYKSFGFAQYSLQADAGEAIFMAKPL
jgi:GNAT superfamily N-acetyltransferase